MVPGMSAYDPWRQWCPTGVRPCPEYAANGVDYYPSYTERQLSPGQDIFTNGAEGHFTNDANGNVTYVMGRKGPGDNTWWQPLKNPSYYDGYQNVGGNFLSSSACPYVLPDVARTVEAGYFESSPKGFYDACTDYSMGNYGQVLQNLQYNVQQLSCDPQADVCCPNVALKAATAEVCTASAEGCGFSASCTVAIDFCHMLASNGQYQPNSDGPSPVKCGVGCDFQPVPSELVPQGQQQYYSNDYYNLPRPLPILRTAADGSTYVQHGLCYNSTLWGLCNAQTSKETCTLPYYGYNTCQWKPRCSLLIAADYSCEASADSCCLPSTSPLFDNQLIAQCGQRTGAGGKPCKVSKECVLAQDPCRSKSSPWQCMASKDCQFKLSAGSTNGICTSLPQSDSCKLLSSTKCDSNPACKLADRCVTDWCPDSSDICCALAGNDAACTATPSCQATTTCLPAMDECSQLTDQAKCAGKGFCTWKELQSAGTGTGTITDPITVNATGDVTGSTGVAINGTGAVNSTRPEGTMNGTLNSTNTSTTTPVSVGVCTTDASKHPCVLATDAVSCANLVDGAGKPRCYAQGNCLTACSRCADCLADVYTSLAAAIAQLSAEQHDPSKVSVAFNAWCRSKGYDSSSCNTIATKIVFSPQGNLARRPGKLCTLLGPCPAGCSVPVKNATTGAITKLPLDMCSNDGTTAGTPVPLPTKSEGACLADSGCSSGGWCEFNFTAPPVCVCEAGEDSCKVMGACSYDICPRLTSLLAVNKDKQSCTNNTQCNPQGGSAYVCNQDAYKTYTCANSNVTAVSHTGYCAEAAPSIVSAQLDDTATTITAALSAAAGPFMAICSSIFTNATVAKIGKDAICSTTATAPNTLVIRLQNVPSFAWDTDKLELRADQQKLLSLNGARAFAGTSTGVVAKCTSCPAPFPVLSGPVLITKPCVGSNTADYASVLFDASGSKGSAAAPISGVAWELAEGSSANITAAINRVSTKADLRGKMLLELSGTDLANSEAGTYALAITVTNSLGESASTIARFVIADAGAKPSISVFAPGNDASGIVMVEPYLGLKLHSKLQVDSVCKGVANQVMYVWTCTASDGSACVVPAKASSFMQLRLEPSDLVALKFDTDYTFTLTAGFAGSAVTSAASAVVRLARSPLRAQLLGPMGDVPVGKNFTLDASRSKDPDNPSASLKYDFACEPQPCFADATYTGVHTKPSSWTIDPLKLSAVGREYTFTVTVSGTAAGDTCTAAASLSVTPKAGSPPTGIVSRFCGYDMSTFSSLACPAKHDPTQDLVVVLKLDKGFEEAAVSWSVAAGGGAGLVEGANAKGLRKSTLTVRPATFPVGALKLLALMAMPGINGTAAITVPLNNPPTCPKPPCFATDVNSTVFPAYTFVGMVSGWQDADGDTLNYEFGQVIDGEYKAREPAGPSTSFVFKGFEPGSYELYACAIDTSGATTCNSAYIEVQPPPVSATAEEVADMVKSSVSKINPAQLASSGSTSAVTAALQELAVLATLAASSASNTNTTSDGAASNSTTNTTAPASVSQEVVQIQNALLTTLTTVMDTTDPAAMGSSLNAADAVSRAASWGLSTQAAEALLDVVDGFVSSNVDAKSTSVPGSQVQRAADVLHRGLGAAFGKGNANSNLNSGRRRSLLAVAEADAAYERLTSSTAGLSALISAGTAVGTTKVAGSTGICLAVTRGDVTTGGLDGTVISLDCSSSASTSGAPARHRRQLLEAVSGNATFVMPTNFSAMCAADPACSEGGVAAVNNEYIADPATTLAVVKDWPAAALVGSAAGNGTTLVAISGVLSFSMGATTSGPICNTTDACLASMTLPVANYQADLGTACMRLDPLAGDESYSLQASTAGVTTAAPGSTSVTCTSSSWGKVVAVQYTLAAAPPAPASEPNTVAPPPAPATVAPPPAPSTVAPTPAPVTVAPAPAPVTVAPAPAPNTVATSPEPETVATSPSPSPEAPPQLGQSDTSVAYAVDESALSEADKGQPVALVFTFVNYNYAEMFSVEGEPDAAAQSAFELAVKVAFLTGVAQQTQLAVVSEGNALQVGRVNITSIKPGSVIVDMLFLAPASAEAADITALKTAVTTNADAFFSTPDFVAAYGAPEVAGKTASQGFYGMNTVQVAVGVSVGLGGALLVGIVVMVILKRRNSGRVTHRAAVFDQAAIP